MYSAIDIAKYIIDKCTVENQPVSNLQLQKILYFIQINYIRLQNCVAFDEPMEAWQHGPVIPDVYNEFVDCGGTKIHRLYENKRKMFKNPMDKSIVDALTDRCRSMNPWELVARSHKVGSPWEKIYNGYKREIPKEVIYNYAIRNN